MRVRPGLLVVGLCVASLLDVAVVRTAEQVLAPVLLPGDALVRRALPGDVGVSLPAGLAERAGQAYAAWVAAVAERPAPASPERRAMVVPVLEHDALRRELIVQAPDVELEPDGLVTHRGVLVGFLRPWRRGGQRVVHDGRARVALLGHRRARPVAGAWLHEPLPAEPVHFLVASREEGPTITHRSRLVRPEPGQLAVTRDVAGLGDVVPAGLLLGRVAGEPEDVPGGAASVRRLDEIHLDSLLDPAQLGLVTIEAPQQAQLAQTVIEAELVMAGDGSGKRWMVDRGLGAGVVRGDTVVQDGRWVGRVAWAGPLTATVVRALPDEPLLVEEGPGQLVPLHQDGVLARPGQQVFGGHPALGGLVVGTVANERGDLSLLPVDPRRPVRIGRR